MKATADGIARPPGGLKRTFVSAVGINAVSMGLTQAITFARSLVLARLLTPDDYGLFGLSFIVMGGLATLTNFNLPATLIQRAFRGEEDQRRALDTVWTLELLRNAVLTVLMVLATRPATNYFRDERAFPILLMCAATPVLSGFTNIGLTLARKDIDFRSILYHRQCSDLLTAVFAVIVAWATRNVWALVASQLFGAALGSILSFWFHPYRPRFLLDRAITRDSLHFGGHLFLVGLFTYITTQFDSMAIGRYLGVATLGAYVLAQRLAYLPVEVMTQALGNVLYPTFAKVHQEDPDRIASTFHLIFVGSAATLVALTAPLALAAKGVIHLLYGERWNEAVPLLAVLAYAGLLRGLARVISPLILATRRPGIESLTKFIEALLFVAATLYFAPRNGAIGVAWAGIISYGLAVAVRYSVVLKLYPAIRRSLYQETGLLFAAGVATTALVTLWGDIFWIYKVLAFELIFGVCGLFIAPQLRTIGGNYLIAAWNGWRNKR